MPYGNITGNSVGYTRTYFLLLPHLAAFGSNSVRAVGGECVSNTSSFTVLSDPWADWWALAVYVVVAAAAALFLLVGLKMGKKWFLLAAAAVYLALAPFTGQRYDVYFLISSGIRLLQHINPFDPGSPPAYPGAYKWAFPPLYVPYGSLSFLAYQAISHATLPSVGALTPPSWYTSMYDVWEAFIPTTLPLLVLLLKLPMVVSAMVTGVLLSKMMKTDSAPVFWLANPLVILVGAVWGALDPIAAALAVAAVYMFQKGRSYSAYLLASMGAAVKIWPALLLPLFLAVNLRKEGAGALKPLVAVLPAVLLSALVYGATGGLEGSVYTLLYARSVPTFYGSFSVNGLTWQRFLSFWNAPAFPVFLAVGVPAYLAVVAWVYYRRERDVVKWTIVSLLIVFLTYNYVNVQYFIWVLPFLILQKRKVASVLFTALPLISILFSYNIFYFVSPAILPNYFSVGASIADQLKVAVFDQTSWLFLLVLGVVPTVCYCLILLTELRPGWLAFGYRLGRRSAEDE